MQEAARKLTKRQRADVVELLRCAADLDGRATFPFAAAVTATRSDLRIEQFAWRVLHLTYNERRDRRLYVRHCLEAAQRVEEGTWP